MSLMGHSKVPECNRLLPTGAQAGPQDDAQLPLRNQRELHFFLHNYVSEHPLPLDGKADPDEWLTQVGIGRRVHCIWGGTRCSSLQKCKCIDLRGAHKITRIKNKQQRKQNRL